MHIAYLSPSLVWTLGCLLESVSRYLLLTERDGGWKTCLLKGSSGSTGTEVEWEDGPYTSPLQI